MARQRANPTPAASSGPPIWLFAAIGVLVAVVIAVVVLQDGDGPPTGATGECTEVSSVPDVHGLAVAPDNRSRIYVATHHGLVRSDDDLGWCRVGAAQDDFMGFSMHPTEGDTFWVSGHPKGGGNMGVRKSTDGGHTWETIALEGVDFHAMTVSRADPDRLWGHFQGRIYRSDDAGQQWDVVSQAAARVAAFAAHPTERDQVYAAGPQGIHLSDDGGATWSLAIGRGAATMTIHPDDPDTMLIVTQDGLERSTDGGENWERLPLDASGTVGHLAFDPSAPDTIYAATYQGNIHRSDDGGENWERIL